MVMSQRLTPLEIMTRLISFPTVSRDTNLPLVDWVEGYLGEHGIDAHRWPDPEQPHMWYEECETCHYIFLDAGEFTDLKFKTLMDLVRRVFR